MLRVRSVLLATALSIAFPTLTAEGSTATVRNEDSAELQKDGRLNQKVSITDQSLFVGELVDKLSKLSGVRLVADEPSGAADELLFIHVKDKPLSHVMAQLRSLFSYRKAEWLWVKEGQQNRWQYRLTKQRGARQLGADLRNWIDDAFRVQAETLARAAISRPESRKAMVSQIQAALYMDNEDFQKYSETFLNTERPWTGLRLFATVFSPGEQETVLRGGRITPRPVSSLTDTALRDVKSIWPSLTQPQGPEPSSGLGAQEWGITFSVRKEGRNRQPSLYVALTREGVTTGIQAYSCGGLADWFTRMLAGRWITEEDLADHENIGRRIRPSDPSQAVTAPDARPTLERRLADFADRSGLSVLARLPEKRSGDLGVAGVTTVGAYLDKLKSVPLIVKWHKDALLLSSVTWHEEEAARTPFRVIADLRRLRLRSAGVLPLSELCACAARLRKEQLLSLSREFPEMSNVAAWQAVLAVFSKHPELLRTAFTNQGAAPNQELVSALSDVPDIRANLAAAMANGPAGFRIRVDVKEEPSGRRVRRFVTFEIVSQNRSYGGAGFSYGPASVAASSDRNR